MPRLLPLLLVLQCALAQSPVVIRIDPPNWWIGMKTSKIQLMLYGEHLANIAVRSSSEGVSVSKVYRVDNPSYGFIDIAVSPTAKVGPHRLRIGKPSLPNSFSRTREVIAPVAIATA